MSEPAISRPRKPTLFHRVSLGLTRARLFVANTLFVLIVLGLLVLLLTSGGRPKVPDGSALVLNPRGVLVDQAAFDDPVRNLVMPDSSPREVELGALKTAIDRATEDDRIDVLVLDLDELESASAAQADTLGEAMRGFKAAGKQIVAFGSYFDQAQYLIASYADALYMHPMGQIVLPGYGTNQIYFKELIDKLKVNIHIFRVGKYKEFVEPFTRTDMSPEARQANQELVDGLWQHYLETVHQNRQIEPEELDRYTQHLPDVVLAAGGDLARAALESHLVDELLTPDQARVRIADKVGYSHSGDINGIGFDDYLAATGGLGATGGHGRKVAIISGTGPVVMGRETRGAMGADGIGGLIRMAREDETVAAVVLRMNTPGGSAFASELIRQELELTQLAGKPVVISMADVAASGGYWIASTADRIFAQPTTITGSIGIFGIVPSFEASLSSIGVSADGVGTSPISRTLNPVTGVNDPMAVILQANIENGYERFINLVARGRSMTPEAVDEIAQGRVWTGSAAKDRGLVDELGGLDAAVTAAANLAHLTEYQRVDFTPPLSPRQMLLRELLDDATMVGATVQSNALGNLLSGLGPVGLQARDAWRLLTTLNDPLHSYAVCEPCSFALVAF